MDTVRPRGARPVASPRPIVSGRRQKPRAGDADRASISVAATAVQADGVTVAGDVGQQCRDVLANIADALAREGSSFDDVERVTYYMRDVADLAPCYPALRDSFSAARPAATMVLVRNFGDPATRIEIAVKARRRP